MDADRGTRRRSYPDRADALTQALIRAVEPYPSYWQESEDRILDRVRRRLAETARSTPLRRMLDAGCGDGRLIPRFADLFEHVTAIDPDGARLAGAARRVEAEGLAGNVALHRVAIEEFRADAPFDFILCSHVIQHVEGAAVPSILSKLSRLLHTRGLLTLLTAHSTTGEDRFAKDLIEGGQFRESFIEEAEFERLVENDAHVLPVRFFAREGLSRRLADHGLEVREYRCYHALGDFGELERHAHRDDIVNALPQLQAAFGRDLYIAATHAGQGRSPA